MLTCVVPVGTERLALRVYSSFCGKEDNDETNIKSDISIDSSS